MPNTLANIARMTTATTGTGTVTLGSAVTGFLSFADAGISNGDVVTYAIEENNEREVGQGTYSSTGPTLTRTTVYSSTASGSQITLTGAAEVFITPAAEDLIDWTNASSDFLTTGSLRVTGGINTANNVAVDTTTLTGHLALFGTTYGFNVTPNNLNFVANAVNPMSLTNSSINSKLQHNFNVQLKINHSYTVGALPTASVGLITRVTDASSPSVGATVSGGGSDAALVWYNGSNWTVIGI